MRRIPANARADRSGIRTVLHHGRQRRLDRRHELVPQPTIDLWPAADKRGDYRYFCSVLIGSALLSTALNLTPLDPAKARYWSAVINGLAAVSLMAAPMPMGSQRKVKGEFTTSWSLKLFGWLTTTAMAAVMFVM